MSRIAIVDCETTGLDPFLHEVWEAAVILRSGGVESEHVFRIEPNLATADPKALEINRYTERTSAPGWVWDDPREAANSIAFLLSGAVMVGSNPAFDAEMLACLLDRCRVGPRPWHYRTVDVATLAAGYLHGRRLCDLRELAPPWSSREVSRAVGIEPPGPDVAHTALGDARWAMSVWDAVTSREVVSDVA